MSSQIASGVEAALITRVQHLYDRHLYLDAFELSGQYWTAPLDIDRWSTDELVLAGRLAARLGGPRLSRRLLRAADDRSPADPRVRLFTSHLKFPKRRPLDDISAAEHQPDVGGDDPELRASWYATHAVTWAGLRDFQRAYACLDRARSILPDDAWVLVCESGVLGLADRWADALKSAERACEVDPDSPFAAVGLGTCLLNLGRVEESAARAYAAAGRSQSLELVLDACWRQCGLAETLDGREREAAIERATRLADRMPSLAPLADRESRVAMARAWLDIAALSDDYVQIERWTGEVRSPFHRQLVANLRRNAEGRRIRLPYNRTIQRHDSCLPASLAAALSAGGVTMAADDIAAEITFGGTPEWAAAAWLRQRDFHVRFFAVTPDLAIRLIRHRIAFVLCWDAEEGGHAVAVVGLDERAGTLLIHDPRSFRTAECLLTILEQQRAPLGIRGMAAVTQERSAQLDALLPPESAVVEAAQEYQRLLAERGPSATASVVADVVERFPSHPGARHLNAVRLLNAGQVGQALDDLLGLLQEFPDAPSVRVPALMACRAVGNLARLRQVLADIVERGVLPGFQTGQEWLRPPERYVFEYADLLRLSSATRDRAEAILHSLLRRQPASAGAWHVLADLLSQKPDPEGALLCHRIASCLAASDEHYAQAYETALASLKREAEGLEWLETRARTLGAPRQAVGTWLSWVSALENRGHPERAIAACHEALERHGHSADSLAFAVAFFARMGLWDTAEAQLRALTLLENPAAVREASASFCEMRGDVRSAAEHCEAWITELPHSLHARRNLLRLIAVLDGPGAAIRRAELWLQANPTHEGFEEVYCEQIDRAGGPRRAKRSLLLRRLRRNPEDAWAWRELAFEYLFAYSTAGDHRRRRLERHIEHVLAECDRTSSEDVSTQRALALWSEVRGDWADAVARSISCIAREPGNFYSYHVAWRCSARMTHGEQVRVWGQIRPLLLNAPGRLSVARPTIALLVERFGLAWAKKEIARWRDGRPDDPDLLEAAVDLLIDHGHGVSDARRALALLTPAVERYPHHAGLRLSLANAYRRAGEGAEAEKVLHEIVRRHPANWPARVQLAWARQATGDQAGAIQILDRAQASEPHNPQIWAARTQLLVAQQRREDVRESIREGLMRMPDDVDWRRHAVALLFQFRAHDEAVAAARDGVVICPHSAQAWLLLGQTLGSMRRYAAPGEIESCVRRSLALNAGLYDSADLLSCDLVDRERYAEAAQVLRDIEPRMPDPSPARGRLAWIKRRQGEHEAALRDLTAAVTAAPWYGWGWDVVLGWLEEDKSWVVARRLLKDVPAPMVTNTAFRARRLALLAKAGVDRIVLDAEWDELLRDFPDDASLQAARSGSAREAEAPEPAGAVSSVAGVPPWVWWAAAMAAYHLLVRGCP